eukprot:3023703-Rhodomonas_salina.1
MLRRAALTCLLGLRLRCCDCDVAVFSCGCDALTSVDVRHMSYTSFAVVTSRCQDLLQFDLLGYDCLRACCVLCAVCCVRQAAEGELKAGLALLGKVSPRTALYRGSERNAMSPLMQTPNRRQRWLMAFAFLASLAIAFLA